MNLNQFSKEDNENDIKFLFQEKSLKRPPKDLMKNFESEVRHKINLSEPRPIFGFSALPVFGCALAAGILIFVWQTMPKTQVVEEKPVLSAAAIQTQAVPTKTVESSPAVTTQTAKDPLVDKMSENLFVLEMLGEAQGLDQVLQGSGIDSDGEVFEQMTNVF